VLYTNRKCGRLGLGTGAWHNWMYTRLNRRSLYDTLVYTHMYCKAILQRSHIRGWGGAACYTQIAKCGRWGRGTGVWLVSALIVGLCIY